MDKQTFVTRSGSGLQLEGKTFRFAGPNIYWLGLDENVGGVDWPTEFRVANALDTALEMGATVVRAHTLAASQGCSKAIMPELGEYNEEAFRKVDFAITEAGLRGLRLVVPFVCNWSYYHGGRETFTKWRGLDDRDAFYTNSDVIADYKAYIAMIVNRVNSFTGIAYKDDPAIMAWELGNELNDAPAAWVADIADYIKSLDGNHLVAHGKQFQLDRDKLAIDSLDILDVHYYPANAAELIKDAEAVAAAGKVYMAGEFGWPQCDLAAFLTAAEEHAAVSGTLFWSLFPHHDTCGYVQHFDGFSVHYPGNGVNEDAAVRFAQLRAHAFAMSGKAVTEHSVPEAPVIAEHNGAIAIRGVVGAAFYTVEKSTVSPEGPWHVLADKRPADHDMPWTDATRAHTVTTWYRVKAHNLSGQAGPYSAALESAAFTPQR
ncbi:hypothetical protein GZH47_13720 [Paenibacillus rhizovicinus]|uniref:mannan endo-1,4-beta-mannosidase n=1 Tax=Paenibacillus rhizovicinus TaxID=2704463 RepID=A0A6C0P1M8_9BACL|nr:hypothetical protein [Paenibacillus rhizovicinus]QHW31793.1 hypothetical protein GZH47_13720 [Paenibacillus rhizovicinus]